MARSVVFVHGLWLHSTSWQPWLELFTAAGYQPLAPEWPGVPDTVAAARADTGPAARKGVAEVTAHYAEFIKGLPDTPIAVGHSFGGLIVQQLLGQGHAAAAVALDPAPFKGVLQLPPSALKVSSVVLRNPANRNRTVALTKEQFRYGFGNALPATESDELYDNWAIPSPGRPLFQAALANVSTSQATKVPTKNSSRGPLLLVSGGRDHTVPPSMVKGAYAKYQAPPAVTELLEFPDRGHSIPIDHGWREVAQASLDWLARHQL
jgi:pimeloyl-ACP methyl ester carboxylesterase